MSHRRRKPCNDLDTIVDNGRKKTMFRLLLDTALKTVTYRWQVIQIVETLVHRQIRFIPIKEGIEFDGQQDLRTKVMIAAGSYVVFQHQSGRYPYTASTSSIAPWTAPGRSEGGWLFKGITKFT